MQDPAANETVAREVCRAAAGIRELWWSSCGWLHSGFRAPEKNASVVETDESIRQREHTLQGLPFLVNCLNTKGSIAVPLFSFSF